MRIEANDLGLNVKALIDTGAPRTIFPRGFGEALGLEVPAFPSQGDRLHHLAGQPVHAVSEFVEFVIPQCPDLRWEAEVDFLIEEPGPLPFGLLGQEGFLNKWAVTFVYGLGYFVIEPADEFESRLPLDPFMLLQEQFPDPSG